MYTNIIRYRDTIILSYDGTFEDCIKYLEQHFGKCLGWGIAGGHGALQFSQYNFMWDCIEKNILVWDTLAWGRPQ